MRCENIDEDLPSDSEGLISAQQNKECNHNFASSSSGASLLVSPKEADGAKNILKDGKDAYMVLPWNSKKSFIISLSEDTVIDKFLLLGGEEFSSSIEYFDIYGSNEYNSENEKWEKLGHFMASKEFFRKWQSFKVKSTWIRYLKFEWKTSYGSYSYWTLTQIKVWGSTMVQGLSEKLKNIDIFDEDKSTQAVITTPVQSKFDNFYDSETQTILDRIITNTTIFGPNDWWVSIFSFQNSCLFIGKWWN